MVTCYAGVCGAMFFVRKNAAETLMTEIASVYNNIIVPISMFEKQ